MRPPRGSATTRRRLKRSSERCRRGKVDIFISSVYRPSWEESSSSIYRQIYHKSECTEHSIPAITLGSESCQSSSSP